MVKLNLPTLEWHGDRAIASWTDELGHRYHVWIVHDVLGPTIYKNAPFNADGAAKSYRDPGYFPTRRLDATAASNRAAIAAVRALLGDDPKAMLAKLRQDDIDAEEAREATARRERVVRIMAAINASDLPQPVKDWCEVAGVHRLRKIAQIVWETK